MKNQEVLNNIITQHIQLFEFYILEFNHAERILELKNLESKLRQEEFLNPLSQNINKSLVQLSKMIKILEFAESLKSNII